MTLLRYMRPKVNKSRVLGIDPSSNSIAFTLIEDGVPKSWGKLMFYRKSTIFEKIKMIPSLVELIIQITNPSYVCLEQTIYVQSPQTMRTLAYINGALICALEIQGVEMIDVAPMVHKNYHGYNKVTKAFIKANKLNQKEAAHLRKSQIQDKILEKWPWVCAQDSDIADSCSIALWGAEISLK